MAIFFLECSPPALSAPKRLFFGFARNGKQGRCAHTCYFCVAGSPAKMLVGGLPKPAGLRDKLSQSPGASACWMRPGLTLLGLIFPPVRMAEQIINVCLDRNGLPHIRLGFAVLGIEGLFLFRELTPPLFQRVHL